jgi:NAD(P)-dependent dehydrogenase (short-subunit alcohol dehydrogenase family)
MEIRGAVALVTGGASGLGEATVRAFHERGAQVVIVDRDEARGQALAQELGAAAAFAAADVTDPAQVQAAILEATGRGPLRFVVQCAGIVAGGRIVGRDGAPHDLELFRKVITVNLIGTFNVLRLAAAAMAAQPPDGNGQRGVVVNTASISAYEGQIGQAAYAASKGGIVGLCLAAARDLAKACVRVMSIAPGTFETPMMDVVPPETKAALGAAVPNPARLGIPSEFGRLALAICENDYLNGEVIRLDGALRMPPR